MLRLRVREVAEAKGLSMNKVSQRSEVSYSIIRDMFINPYKVINTDTLGRIAEALNVSVKDLIEDGPGPDRQEAQVS